MIQVSQVVLKKLGDLTEKQVEEFWQILGGGGYDPATYRVVSDEAAFKTINFVLTPRKKTAE